MPGFHLFTSNSMEILVANLAEKILHDRIDPFKRKLVVVQSIGMEKWVTLKLADIQKITANIDYPFPNKFIGNLITSSGLLEDNEGILTKDYMVWRIYLHLQKNMTLYPEISFYLEDSLDSESYHQLKLYQLVNQLADLYDQYTLFRPEWFDEWTKNTPSENWQARLWNNLYEEGLPENRGSLYSRLIQKLKNSDNLLTDSLPTQINIFGIPFLPPAYLNILIALSTKIDINYFLLNPCKEYWSDIITTREQCRKSRESLIPDDELYLITGHNLLANNSRLERDFLELLFSNDQFIDWQELFTDTKRISILNNIQQDILELNNTDISEDWSISKIQNDSSIVIASCHSRLREIEELHNYLLDELNKNKNLKPDDILVMLPDVEEYLPFIHSVFSNCDESLKIPYTLADRSFRSSSQLAESFMKILSIEESRFTLTYVFDLLENDMVALSFKISSEEIIRLKEIIQKANIRWGISADYRSSTGVSHYSENSWNFGLDRLLMGYATGEINSLIEGIAPLSLNSESDSELLGKFFSFYNSLTELYEKIDGAHTITTWHEILISICKTFFKDKSNIENDYYFMIETVTSLLTNNELIADNKFYLPVIKSYLARHFSQEVKSKDFLNGKVTFCAMLPMRSIPFRVIALLGMNDKIFPRPNLNDDLNLIYTDKRRPCDRSLRDEDRYLFLETLISARDCLYLSYIGKNQKDNTIIAPSVLISELIDEINTTVKLTDQTCKATDYIIKNHRLHPHHSEYFKNSNSLFSYYKDNLDACNSISLSVKHADSFWPDNFSLDYQDKEISLSDVIRFFKNPQKYICTQKLGIRLEIDDNAFTDSESLAYLASGERLYGTPDSSKMNNLDRYKILSRMLEASMGNKLNSEIEIIKKEGLVSPLNMGDYLLNNFQVETDSILLLLKQFYTDIPDKKKIELKINLDNSFSLCGEINDFFRPYLLYCRPSSVKGKDIIGAWINHLAFCCLKIPFEGTIVAGLKKSLFKLSPVENASDYLTNIIEFFISGNQRPLLFHPWFLDQYFDKIFAKKNAPLFNEALLKIIESSINNDNSNEFDYFNLLFGEKEIDKLSLIKNTSEIVEPILDHLVKI